jgi:transcriptional regulator with XRE-family HTH domain
VYAESGMLRKQNFPLTEQPPAYYRRMKKAPAKTVLWANVSALMEHHFHEVNLNRLAREAGIGVGTVARIKDGENSTGLNILEAIAAYFKIEPWQLLVPDLEPARPVTLPTDSDRRKWLASYDRLNARRRRKLLDMAEEFSDDEGLGKEAM